jgi:mannose-6-phosphate isomerase-like protein (cupin superfamily)
LGVTLSEFFADNLQLPAKRFYRADELKPIARTGTVRILEVGGRGNARSVQLLVGHYAPDGDTGPEMFVHDGEEAGVIVCGRFEITVGDETVTLAAGDAYRFDSRMPHRFRNISGEPGKIISANAGDSL